MNPNHPDWDAYADEMVRRQDARSDALEDGHDANPYAECDCGFDADTEVWDGPHFVRYACVDCAMSFVPVLSEPLPPLESIR